MEIVDRLKLLLDKLEINKSELAHKTEISKGNVSSYFSGSLKPGKKFLLQLQKVYNINPAWVMYGQGSMFLDQEHQYQATGTDGTLIPISIKIRQLRESKQITTAQIAADLEVSPEEIESIEKGKEPSEELVYKLREKYNIEIRYCSKDGITHKITTYEKKPVREQLKEELNLNDNETESLDKLLKSKKDLEMAIKWMEYKDTGDIEALKRVYKIIKAYAEVEGL